VSGSGSWEAKVAADGGGAEGGEASVTASGSLSIIAVNGAAGIEARGGESSGGAGAGGAAAVTGDGIFAQGGTMLSGTTASVKIFGGTSQEGVGDSVVLNSTGSQVWNDVTVAARRGEAREEIMAGGGDTGGDDWEGALLHAKDLAISASGAAAALVSLGGGGGALSGKGGEVSVKLEGNLSVSGAMAT
jgi:hypothetical protein